MITLIPERGERVLIMGQTGSGKTLFAVWMIKRIQRAPIVIYDTKGESKFLSLQPSIVVNDFSDVVHAYNEGQHDYIILQPPPEMLGEPKALDDLLFRHYLELPLDAYIDEIKTFHTTTGRVFKGLMSLLERGRSKGITTIMSTQRPAFMSKSAMTEAQKMFIFYLGYEDDIKRVAAFVPAIAEKPPLKPKAHMFYYYDVPEATLTLFKPVKLDKGIASGYVDTETVEKPDTDHARRMIWS